MEMMMTLFGGYMVMSFFFSFSQFDADPTRLVSSYYCLYIL